MPRKILLILITVALGACSFELPDFVGRQGGGGNTFSFTPEEFPSSESIPIVSAKLDPGLGGVIIQVEGLAPTQGYYSAQLLTLAAIPIDEAQSGGVRSPDEYFELQFVAYPPPEPQTVGPESGRKLLAALFVPNRYLQDSSGFRIYSGSASRTLSLN